MSAAADQWLTTTEAKILIEVPMRDIEALRQRIRKAYEVGYRDGRRI